MAELITIPRATVKQALEALENSSPDQYPEDAGVFYDAKDALRAALEQPIDYFAVQRIANERGLDYNRFAAALRDYAALVLPAPPSLKPKEKYD